MCTLHVVVAVCRRRRCPLSRTATVGVCRTITVMRKPKWRLNPLKKDIGRTKVKEYINLSCKGHDLVFILSFECHSLAYSADPFVNISPFQFMFPLHPPLPLSPLSPHRLTPLLITHPYVCKCFSFFSQCPLFNTWCLIRNVTEISQLASVCIAFAASAAFTAPAAATPAPAPRLHSLIDSSDFAWVAIPLPVGSLPLHIHFYGRVLSIIFGHSFHSPALCQLYFPSLFIFMSPSLYVSNSLSVVSFPLSCFIFPLIPLTFPSSLLTAFVSRV